MTPSKLHVISRGWWTIDVISGSTSARRTKSNASRDSHSIGIADIAKPDYGDPVPVEADEIAVFWACGVTPQAVIAAAKLPFAITHAPGLMLVTDLRNKQFAVL